MHELPVTQGILDIALDAAVRAGALRITAIDLVIGELTGMLDDSIQFYFDIISRDTLAEGALLRFRREVAMATCLDCGAESEVHPPLIASCPACGGTRLRIAGGREFRVESIQVDDGAPSEAS